MGKVHALSYGEMMYTLFMSYIRIWHVTTSLLIFISYSCLPLPPTTVVYSLTYQTILKLSLHNKVNQLDFSLELSIIKPILDMYSVLL